MNVYVRNPEEYKRVTRLIKAGLLSSELAFIARGLKTWQLAKALGLQTQSKGRGYLLNAIVKKVNSGKYPELPIDENAPLPEIEEEEPKIDVDDLGPECDGCGGVTEVKDVLRWGKALKGEAVTYRVKYSTIPDYLKETLTAEWWGARFGTWAAVCGITFQEVKRGGDIVIDFGEIDGAGSVLGMAWQPSVGTEMDVGDLSGDLTIDNSERWNAVPNFWHLIMTVVHEIGHAIGLKHINNLSAILSPTPLGAGERGLHRLDIQAAVDAYPLRIAA